MNTHEREFVRRVLLTHPKKDELQDLANSIFNPDADPSVVVPNPRTIAHRFFEIFDIQPPAKNASVRIAELHYVRALSAVTGLDVEVVGNLLRDQPSEKV